MQPLAAFVAILLVFIHFSNIAELTYTLTGVNFRLMYWVAPFAYAAVLFSGGLTTALRSKWAILFVLFTVWMVMALPFSTWKGGSIGTVKTYLMVVAPMIFVTAGLILTWKQVRATFFMIAVAGILVAANTMLFGEMRSGTRMALTSSGMLGNSNDIASHLVLTMGFLVFLVIDPKRNFLVRIGALATIGYSIVVILQTASRGALVSLVVGALFLIWKAPLKMRVATIATAVVMAIVTPVLLSDAVVSRFATLMGGEHAEADESQAARSYLFWQSVRFTFQRPIFGVGPGQFINYEGKTAVSEGLRGNWHATHCSWTQISSECGLPAALFVIVAIGGSLWGVLRVYDEAKKRGHIEIRNTCLCFLIAAIPFYTSITFLSNAYRFYIPTLIGLAIVLAHTAKEQLEADQKNLAPHSDLVSPAA
jgi:O-antigen ligase